MSGWLASQGNVTKVVSGLQKLFLSLPEHFPEVDSLNRHAQFTNFLLVTFSPQSYGPQV